MGQYFKAALIWNEWQVKVVNLNGWKLMEHSWYWNESMRRVEKLLYREAKNVYWIWDYSIMSWFVWKHKFEDEEEKIWDYKWESYSEDELLQKNPDEDYFLVNHFSWEFINMTRQEMNKELWEDEKWKNVVHPLPLLTRAETEEAWWWYHSDIGREHIWKWCWDMISIMSWKREEMEKALKDNWKKDMTDIYFFKE